MVYKDILANGMRVLTEELPHLHSVATGVWAGIGAAHEPGELGGISHYLEHMLFKGTKNRNAKELAEEIESVGGQINAFTSREYTCYYTKTIDEDFSLSLDILSDMYLNSLIDESEFEKEKGVILEEISMYEDSPDDMVQDLFPSALWQGHDYGRPVIGSRETVSALKAEDLKKYLHNSYCPEKTVISVAGNVKRERVLAEVDKFFKFEKNPCQIKGYAEPVSHRAQKFIYKDIEQTHICLGLPAIKESDADYYTANVLNTALGGGVSSRLFQEAREKRGLCYSVYSYLSAYTKGGYLAAYASASPHKVCELIKIIWEQMADICRKGLNQPEIDRAKQQLKGSLLLGMENSNNVMSRMGRMETTLGRILSVDEVVERLMNVSNEDIQKVAQRLFKGDKLVLATVGPKACQIDLAEFI